MEIRTEYGLCACGHGQSHAWNPYSIFITNYYVMTYGTWTLKAIHVNAYGFSAWMIAAMLAFL